MVLCGGAIDEVEPRAELDASDDRVEKRDDNADAELKRLAPLPLLSWRAQDSKKEHPGFSGFLPTRPRK